MDNKDGSTAGFTHTHTGCCFVHFHGAVNSLKRTIMPSEGNHY